MVSTEDTTPKAHALVEAFSVAYKLRSAGADYAGESAQAFAVPEDMQRARAAHLEQHRASARSRLQQQAAALVGEDRSHIEQHILSLDAAATIGQIDAIASRVTQEITLLSVAITNGTLLVEDTERQSTAAINAAHQRLYAADAIYRAQIDMLATEANRDRQQADARDEKTDELLRRHGITTSVDAELEEQRRRRALAEQRGDMIEMFRFDGAINQLRERQLVEAREQAVEQGKPELVETLDREQPQRKRETEAAVRRQETATQRFLEAQERELKRKEMGEA